MEAVRKKSRRSHNRKKARQQAAAQDDAAAHTSSPSVAEGDSRDDEDFMDEEQRADQEVAALVGDSDALSVLENVEDAHMDVDEIEQTDVATLDQEIAENEEALLAILGEGTADEAVVAQETDADATRTRNVEELLVAEASGSFPSNHGNHGDGPLEQPSGFDGVVVAEHGEDAVGVASGGEPAPQSPVPLKDHAAQETPASVHTPSAPDLDMSDEDGLDHSMFAPASIEAIQGVAAPSAPPLFPDMDEDNTSHLAAPEALDAPPAATVPQARISGSVDAPTDTGAAQQPEVQKTVLPVRPSAPHAFHSVAVESTEANEGPVVSGAFVPSAPLELEIDEDYATHRETPSVASAPSLSPTGSKQLRHVVNVEDPAKLQSVSRSRPHVIADASVESASVAVRTSLAKSKVSEAHRSGIYPSVPARSKESASATTSARSDKEKERKTYESLLKKQHIRVNLEPFVNFEMNLMRAEASQKRQEMKMRHIETNKGELYGRLERYLFSEYILHTAASSLESSKKEIDALVKKGTLADGLLVIWIVSLSFVVESVMTVAVTFV